MEKKLADFFRTECDYTLLLQEIIAAQAQLLNVYEKMAMLPESEQPATNYITDVLFLLGKLMPILEPEKNDTSRI